MARMDQFALPDLLPGMTYLNLFLVYGSFSTLVLVVEFRIRMTQRIAFKVIGEVQGVNFRAFTVESGQRLGLTGNVKNTPAGDVEGEAQGDENNIKDFIKQLNKGPSAASVEKVEHHDVDVKQGESSFSR